MPYPRREKISWQPGSYYHMYNRGARRKSIFFEQDNYLMVIRNFKKYCLEFDLTIIAYCLMPNHYHILARQNGDHRAGLLPQRSFLSYTQAFNKRYNEARFSCVSAKAQTREKNAKSLICTFDHVGDGFARQIKQRFR